MTDLERSLKSCPFCGSAAKIADPEQVEVCCTNEDCIGSVLYAEPEDWNRRTA